jgi:hypothetical protein
LRIASESRSSSRASACRKASGWPKRGRTPKRRSTPFLETYYAVKLQKPAEYLRISFWPPRTAGSAPAGRRISRCRHMIDPCLTLGSFRQNDFKRASPPVCPESGRSKASFP